MTCLSFDIIRASRIGDHIIEFGKRAWRPSSGLSVKLWMRDFNNSLSCKQGCSTADHDQHESGGRSNWLSRGEVVKWSMLSQHRSAPNCLVVCLSVWAPFKIERFLPKLEGVSRALSHALPFLSWTSSSYSLLVPAQQSSLEGNPFNRPIAASTTERISAPW